MDDRDNQVRTTGAATADVSSAQGAAVAPSRPSLAFALVRALRPVQWVKNLLVFVPVAASHNLSQAVMLGRAGVAFACFCAAASATYLVNDLLDAKADRLHPTKRYRPIAAGLVAPGPAVVTAAALYAVAVAAAVALLPTGFVAMLAVYIAVTLAYSLKLKEKLLLDVFCLAGLYTLRVLAGARAVGVAPSNWLLAFSMFLFFSLAFAKRHAELARQAEENRTPSQRRGYIVEDLSMLRSFGATTGGLAVLVFCLYIAESQDARELYPNPFCLWLAAPLLLYWIARVWFAAGRGLLTEDPVVFAVKDAKSYLVALATGVLFVVASVDPGPWRSSLERLFGP